MSTPERKLADELQQALRPNQLPGILTAAFFGTVMVLIYAMADVSLLVARSRPELLGVLFGMLLVGAAMLAAVTSLSSGFRGCMGGTQEVQVVILAVMLSNVHNALGGATVVDDITALQTTSVALMLLSTLLVGISAWVAGWFRVGRFIRYIPYPVVTGFLAGTGALLVLFAIGLCVDLDLASLTGWQELGTRLVASHASLQLALCTLVAASLYLLASRESSRMAIPLVLLGTIMLFLVIRQLAPIDELAWRQHGWLLSDSPPSMHYPPMRLDDVDTIRWDILASQLPQIAVLAIMSLIAVLIKISTLEIMLGSDVDHDRELRTMGMANLGSAAIGGMPGFHVLSMTQLVNRLNTHSRLTGVLVGLFCLLSLAFAADILVLMPRFLSAGMILWIGVDLLRDSLIAPARYLGRLDYTIVVAMMLTVLAFGFLPAIALGLAASVVLFVIDYSRVDVIRQQVRGDQLRSNVDRSPGESRLLQSHGREILALRLHGYVFFGTAYRLIEQIRQALDEPTGGRVRFLVLDVEKVSAFDASASHVLTRIHALCEQHDLRLVISAVPRGLDALLSQRLVAQRSAQTDARSDKRLDTRSDTQADTRSDARPDVRSCSAPAAPIFRDTLDLALEWCEDQQLSEYHVDIHLPEHADPTDWFATVFGDSDTQRLSTYFTKRLLSPGECLFDAGCEQTHLYFVSSGTLEVTVRGDDGHDIRIRKVGPGAILGEISLYRAQPATARVTAAEASELLSLSRDALGHMLDTEPRLAARFHERMARVLAERLADNTRQIRMLSHA